MLKIFNRIDVSLSLTIIWMIVIFYLSHQPATESSALSSRFLHVINELFVLFSFTIEQELLHFLIRKAAHFTAYFVLGGLIFHTLQIGRKGTFPLAVSALSISILYAISDEIHQFFIPGRSGEVRDVLIDSIGASTGIAFYILVRVLMHKTVNHRL